MLCLQMGSVESRSEQNWSWNQLHPLQKLLQFKPAEAALWLLPSPPASQASQELFLLNWFLLKNVFI